MTHYFKVKLAGRKGWRFAALEELPYTCCGEPSVEEQLGEYFTENDERYEPGVYEPARVEIVRDVTNRSKAVGVTRLAVVSQSRAYGGPEEGGWYYDAETLVREFTVPSRSAERVKARLERYCAAVNPERRRYDSEWLVVRRNWQQGERPHYC